MPATSFPEVPWDPAYVSETLPDGHVLGNRYVDRRGRIFILWQIDPTLIRDTFATGECAALKASHVATNDVSDASNATYPTFAGMALGSLAESTSGGTTRYGLFLVNGRATATITDGNVVLASAFMLELDTSVDGGCLPVDETSTSLAAGRDVMFVGHALADDVSLSANVWVKSKVFG